MNRLDDHYQYLGLEVSASSEAVQRAVENLAEQADVLAYTSPQRSNEMWNRIRQIRQDLLTDPGRRAAYNEALLRARAAPYIPAAASVPAAGVAGASNSEPFPMRRATGASILGVLAAGAVAAAVLLANMSGTPKHPGTPLRTTAMALSVTGQSRDGKYASGHPISLQWSPVPHAREYLLRIMTLSSGRRVLYGTVITRQTSYRLTLLGEQRYLWQVQPLVNGHWGRASRWETVVVARPGIGVPVPVSPSDHATVMASQVQFCWTPVPGAVGYRLRIRGVGGRSLQDSCAWMSVHSGAYRWTVAALVTGVQTYTGTYTSKQYFNVVAQVAARVTPHHHLAPRQASHRPPAHSISRNGKPAGVMKTQRHAAPRSAPIASSVVVAAALIPRSTTIAAGVGGGALPLTSAAPRVSPVIRASIFRRIAASRAPRRVASAVQRAPIVRSARAVRTVHGSTPTATRPSGSQVRGGGSSPIRPRPRVHTVRRPVAPVPARRSQPSPPAPPRFLPQPPPAAPVPAATVAVAVPVPAQPVYGAVRSVTVPSTVARASGTGPSLNTSPPSAGPQSTTGSRPVTSPPVSQPVVSPPVSRPVTSPPVTAPVTTPVHSSPPPAAAPPATTAPVGHESNPEHPAHPEHPQHPEHPAHGKGH